MTIRSLLGLSLYVLKHHPIQSIWLNFKMLPFHQAIKLPILIYSSTKFRNLSGTIIIKGTIEPFMIRIGYNTCYPITNKPQTTWDIRGTLVLTGPILFIQGTYILVAEDATLTFGSKGTFVGADSKIMCFESITIGDSVQMTWETQIYDTSFHYIETEDRCSNLTKPIVIGDYCWIGNRCTISKGCILPNWSIVGNGSLINKDYSSHGSYCLFIGYPARMKKQGVKRLFDKARENDLDVFFKYHRNHL